MATGIKDRMIPSMDTLVKYDNPVLVTTRPEKVQFFLNSTMYFSMIPLKIYNFIHFVIKTGT